MNPFERESSLPERPDHDWFRADLAYQPPHVYQAFIEVRRRAEDHEWFEGPEDRADDEARR